MVLTYRGDVHYKTTAARKAVLAEAWERGIPATVVIAQEYEPVPDRDPSEGSPLVRADGNQLEARATPRCGGEVSCTCCKRLRNESR